MAMGDPYITGTQLGEYIQNMDLAKTDALRDQELESAASAASRAIRKACGRDFNTQTNATPRIFNRYGSRLVIVDDFYTTDDLEIASETSSAVFDSVWDATDFVLGPLTVDGVGDHPFTYIKARHSVWPCGRVQVTAKWGWEETPADIIQATKILGAELFKLRAAPFGVVQNGGRGASSVAIPVQDVPQAWRLICEYQRSEKAVFLG